MTRKPNFCKCILGMALLSIMVIGIWAATYAPSTSAKKVGTASNVARGGAKVTGSQPANAPDLHSPIPLASPTPGWGHFRTGWECS